MIIDTHLHFYDPRRRTGASWPSPEDSHLYRPFLPADYERLPMHTQISTAVVIEAGGWPPDNEWLLNLARANPWIEGVVGYLDYNERDFFTHMQILARQTPFKGLRLNGAAFSDDLRPVLDLMTECNLSLDILNPLPRGTTLLHGLRSAPDLNVIINHFGGGNNCLFSGSDSAISDEWKIFMQSLAELPNVFVKLSAVTEQFGNKTVKMLETATVFLRRTFGCDRLLYGSNWPVCETAGSAMETIALIKPFFKKREMDLIFQANARKAYHLD